jgi:hypothetical protein
VKCLGRNGMLRMNERKRFRIHPISEMIEEDYWRNHKRIEEDSKRELYF